MTLTAKQLAAEVGMLSEGEVELIHQTVLSMGDGLNDAVVIGANVGTATIAILEKAPQHTVVLSVDIKPCQDEKTNLVKAGINPFRTIRLLGDSKQIGRFFHKGCDLLFVDGDHTDAGCLADWNNWKRNLREEGVVFFHDYEHRNLPSLTKVIDKIAIDDGLEFIGKSRYLIAFRKP